MSSHYFSQEQDPLPSKLRSLSYSARGKDFKMNTADGVFSAKALDIATAILLDQVPQPPATGTFLDLGCGWGPIAAALAVESPKASIWAVDVNPRALELAKKNLAAIGGADVVVLDEDEALEKADQDGTHFDVIWSNPPVRIGKSALQQLLLRWLPKLSNDGVAYLVIGKNLGSDSLAKWLKSQGFNANRLGSKRGFRVLEVRKDV